MRIIVHAGLNKTGSSAIQAYLSKVRGALQDDGVIYPDLGAPCHWKLAAALKLAGGSAKTDGYLVRRAKKLAREADPLSLEQEDPRETVAAAIRAAAPSETLILSQESFSTRGQAEKLASYLGSVAGGASVSVIGYARAPTSLYMSDFPHSLKGLGSFPAVQDWKSSHPARAAALRSVFGDAVTIHVHDRGVLARGDVVEDFRDLVEQVIGRPLPAAPHVLTNNESFSAPACALLFRHKRNAAETSRLRHATLRGALLRFSVGRNDPKIQLPKAWAAGIVQRNAAPWNETVAIMPYDDATKATLRLDPPREEPARVGEQEFAAWLDSYFDRQFTAEFRDDLEKMEIPNARAEREIHAWLTQQIEGSR